MSKQVENVTTAWLLNFRQIEKKLTVYRCIISNIA